MLRVTAAGVDNSRHHEAPRLSSARPYLRRHQTGFTGSTKSPNSRQLSKIRDVLAKKYPTKLG
jgi:hypothetical protein